MLQVVRMPTEQHGGSIKLCLRDLHFVVWALRSTVSTETFARIVAEVPKQYVPLNKPNAIVIVFVGAGKDFVPPYEDPELKLGGLLALNLHEFSSDVEEIADQVPCVSISFLIFFLHHNSNTSVAPLRTPRKKSRYCFSPRPIACVAPLQAPAKLKGCFAPC